MIVYLHGFRSSPDSAKALALKAQAETLGLDWYCPQLPASPLQAVDEVMSFLADYSSGEVTLVGASLGGLYATWMAERLSCRAILLNPVVKMPAKPEQFTQYKTDFAGRPFAFAQREIDELAQFILPAITQPKRYLLLASTADEVLNYQDMVAHYQGAKQILIEGDSHRMMQFEHYINVILTFAQS